MIALIPVVIAAAISSFAPTKMPTQSSVWSAGKPSALRASQHLTPDKHIRRANRYLAKCLAPTAPAGEDRHDFDVATGEFIAWWGAAEFQAGTVQVWWAHWPKKDHNPTLAGVIFSTYGVEVDSDLYRKVDACTSAAVNYDIRRSG